MSNVTSPYLAIVQPFRQDRLDDPAVRLLEDRRRAVLPQGALVFLQPAFLAAVALSPVLFPFETDLFGWLSLACVEAIVLGGFLRAQGYGSLFAESLRLALALTLPWVMVSPFGSPCDASAGCFRSFPMQHSSPNARWGWACWAPRRLVN